MKLVVDENVSYSVVEELRSKGWEVIAVAEKKHSGLDDKKVFSLVRREDAVFITRDFHFTNPIRFPTEKTSGIIYLSRGNLSSHEEMNTVIKFLTTHDLKAIKGRLVTLSPSGIKIR